MFCGRIFSIEIAIFAVTIWAQHFDPSRQDVKRFVTPLSYRWGLRVFQNPSIFRAFTFIACFFIHNLDDG